MFASRLVCFLSLKMRLCVQGIVGPTCRICWRLYRFNNIFMTKPALFPSLLKEKKKAGSCGSRIKNEQHMVGAASVCLISIVPVSCINE